MNIVVDIFSIITLSGFSRVAEFLVGKLSFPKVLASFNISEVIALIVMLILLISPKTLIISFKDFARSFTKKIYPNSVIALKYKGKIVKKDTVDRNTMLFLSAFEFVFILSFILSFEAASFSDALLISTAVLGNSGWILLLIGKSSVLAGFSVWMKLLICICLLPRKIQKAVVLIRRKKTKKQSKLI